MEKKNYGHTTKRKKKESHGRRGKQATGRPNSKPAAGVHHQVVANKWCDTEADTHDTNSATPIGS